MEHSASTPAQNVLLEDLPVEVLLRIFCSCEVTSLVNVALVNRKLSALCADELLWRKMLRKFFLPFRGPSIGSSSIEWVSSAWRSIPAKTQCQLITRCKSKETLTRTPTRFKLPFQSSRSSNNSKNRLCMHKVFVDDGGVWSSDAEAVYCLPWRIKPGFPQTLTTDPRRAQQFRREDLPVWNIGDFAVGPQHLVTGHWDGSVTVRNVRTPEEVLTIKPHISDVHSVAVRDSLVVSGSRDHTVSLFDIGTRSSLALINVDDRLWSVAIHPTDPVIALGTSGTAKKPVVKIFKDRLGSDAVKVYDVEPSNLRLFDCEKETMIGNLEDGFKHGFGTLGTQFVDSQTLLSGGHDGILRQWDLRTHVCSLELDSDMDSAVYCFATDGLFSILSGHANYNAVCYWDKRFPRYAIKTRSMAQEQGDTTASSSVYGLAFTPFELYLGLIDGVYKTELCA